MRLAAYAGASTALAVGVVFHAFNERPNFYSACVYLAQSNLCLMILTNLILLLFMTFMYYLQRIFYGQLRPIEIEQLYEKGWFAVTETCLAMTIFREEVGAWFLVMFVALIAGKVWIWIGEGRVEVLEQQPPANPRLFHIRLSLSLALSVFYGMWIFAYCVKTVIEQARPNMMVMFLFEFAILTTSSYATALRYVISLVEANIVKKQTKIMLEIRRREVREQREEIIRQREAAAENPESSEPINTSSPLPSEDDIDEMDIEVPGWEAKGQWILTLDLITDFIKLAIYSAFFFILLTFYGLPIHIMRDLFMTTRSFLKRLTAFLKYRNATRDMNARYPDATAEEIQREDTCIICREEMRPWSDANPAAPAPGAAPNGPAAPPPARPTIINERSRAKKLPCGHVLHLGCLKSWLERQQVCPTCRRPVVESRPTAAQPPRPAPGAQPQIAGQAPIPGVAPQAQHAPAPGNHGMNLINLGPIRFGFGAMRGPIAGDGMAHGAANPNAAVPPGAAVFGMQFGFPGAPQQAAQQYAPQPGSLPRTSIEIQAQLQRLEQQIAQEFQSLAIAHAELRVLRNMQAELARLRQVQTNVDTQHASGMGPVVNNISTGPSAQRHGPAPGATSIPAGSPDLPPGVTIPEGWSLLPLRNLDQDARRGASTVPTTTTQLPFGFSTSASTSTLPRPPLFQTTGTPPASSAPAPSASAPPQPPVPSGTSTVTADSSQSGAEATTLTPTPTISSTETTAQDRFAAIVQAMAANSNTAASTTSEASTIGATTITNGNSHPADETSEMPNWVTNLLFPGPGSTNGSSVGSETQTPAHSDAETSNEQAVGKGKQAATVEDAGEEASGSA